MVQQVGQPADEPQPEAQAGAAFFGAAVELAEVVEDPALIGLGNAGAAVPDLEPHDPAVPAASDEDAPLVGIANRIGNQIVEDPFEQAGVAAHHQVRRHEPQLEPLFIGNSQILPMDAPKQRGKSHVFDIRCDRSRFQFRHIQQRVQQATRERQRVLHV